MPRYVALLRGVNVGKGNRVPMAEWRTQLEKLGASRVRTLINSGNAVFSHAARSGAPLAGRIRAALAEGLDVDVPVIVRSAAEMAAIAKENVLAKTVTDHARLLVVFPADAAALAGLEAIRPLVRAPEKFAIGRHAAYLWCANGSLESEAGKALLGRSGRAVTTRNWATVMKLVALLDEAEG
jgi:uncharacterized protein (DUF1697 family)